MPSDELIETFEKADRQLKLNFLAHLIDWLTILARDWYNQPAKSEQLEIINEYNHRLAGHLMQLVGHHESVEAWRLAAIKKVVEGLPSSIRSKLGETLEPKIDDK